MRCCCGGNPWREGRAAPIRSARAAPLTSSSLGGRILSATQLPLFLIRPPRDYGVLQTTGRKSGKRRRCCGRIVGSDDQACVVAIGGRGVGWLANLEEDPQVAVRIRGGWRNASARAVAEAELPADLRSAYAESVGLFCYGEYLMWRTGRPTADGIKRLHTAWLARGTPVLLELEA
jgi:deazaflavin-dependent oxidoreductase (nitroreductase family)